MNYLVATIEDLPVQKGLCYFTLTVAVIVFACFLADLVLGLAGQKAIAPLHFADETMVTDIIFIVCSLVVGVLAWFTLKEQV